MSAILRQPSPEPDLRPEHPFASAMVLTATPSVSDGTTHRDSRRWVPRKNEAIAVSLMVKQQQVRV